MDIYKKERQGGKMGKMCLPLGLSIENDNGGR